MNQLKHILKLMLLAVVVTTAACNGQTKAVYKSPPGYDLNKPEKFDMPPALNEISGIAFVNGDNSTIYAEEDEDGVLYFFRPGDKNIKSTRFGKHGDYEDMAICKGYVVMLRSDGVLFTFPLNETNQPKTNNVKKLTGILPPGEYESLYADEQAGNLYLLCKNCNIDNSAKSSSGYIFQLVADGSVKQAGTFNVNVKAIEKTLGLGKIRFRPSAIAQNPASKQWYILSSVNKMLVLTDAQWNVQQVYRLDPALYQQPEGIAFDSALNLYISNEKNDFSHGTILKFVYHK